MRNIEKEAFPETEEVMAAKAEAKKLNIAFRMVDLNINEATCWLIDQTIKMRNEKQGDFSLEDAVSLRLKMEDLYLID